MASLAQHKSDTLRVLGEDFEEVHKWLDAGFAWLGPKHRRLRHHLEGAKEAGKLFGQRAELAARVHILRDCRHIPHQADYDSGAVDALGLKQWWPTAAYIRYSDEDFMNNVKQHLEPTGLILWAFLLWSDARNFLTSFTQLNADEVLTLEERWRSSQAALERASLESIEQPFRTLETGQIDTDVAIHLEEMTTLLSPQLEGLGSTITPGYVNLAALLMPLVYIDYELLEEVKAELSGTDPLDVVRFALPRQITSKMKAVGDVAGRTVSFVSNSKTLNVSEARLRQTDQGTEVSFLVSAAPTGIVISQIGDRYIIRNGIHRAYLLMKLGFKEVPCLFVQAPLPIPVISSSYPAFSPQVLVQKRPPMLTDLLNEELCLQASIQRTHKVITVNAQSVTIPVD